VTDTDYGGGNMNKPKTLVEKVWERHVVRRAEGEPDLLYVDLHCRST
jgi:homoaconitase/3-isopropylmalate dehydratase large subunit